MSAKAKRHAGEYAANLARGGMLLGLGTGSTAACAIGRLGERISEEGLRITGIPTSRSSEELARKAGIPLEQPRPDRYVDLYIDGADEVDAAGRLIKGGGGALLREKVVAVHSRYRVIVADPSKHVETLGRAFPLPVEVVPFGHALTAAHLHDCTGAEPVLRVDKTGTPVTTDNGGFVYDCHFPTGIADPEAVASALDGIVGVIEHGLFIGLCDLLVTGNEDGVETARITETMPGTVGT